MYGTLPRPVRRLVGLSLWNTDLEQDRRDLDRIAPQLFERILIPAAVRDELQSAGAREAIVRFMAAPPVWLETQRRRHSTLGQISPAAFERRATHAA